MSDLCDRCSYSLACPARTPETDQCVSFAPNRPEPKPIVEAEIPVDLNTITFDFERVRAELDQIPVTMRGTVLVSIDVRELRALVAIQQLVRELASELTLCERLGNGRQA